MTVTKQFFSESIREICFPVICIPFSHMMPPYPERHVHWFGRAHLQEKNIAYFENTTQQSKYIDVTY